MLGKTSQCGGSFGLLWLREFEKEMEKEKRH